MSSLSIRKTIAGHIDMSKVVAVRGPFFGAYADIAAWFEIDVQLRDSPIKAYIQIDLERDMVAGPHGMTYARLDGQKRHWSMRDDPSEGVIGQRVQRKIDEFVAEWKQWRDA